MSEQQTEVRTCRFPGCPRPAVPAEADTGRPPEYCDDPKHNRAAAWRARQRLAGGPAVERGDEARPVDAARQRASEITGQVTGMVEHLTQQLTMLVEQLRTVGDPEAVEAQLEAVNSEAAEQVAAARARATRAEQAQRRAEAEKDEADAAAAEATQQVEDLTEALGATTGELDQAREAGERLADELAQVRAAAERAQAQAEAEAGQLRADLEALTAQLARAEQDRDAAVERATAEERARIDAEQRAAAAESRADAEAGRAERAEVETIEVRGQLDAVRTDLDRARDAAADLRGTIAALTAERDGARGDVERERAHGDQRVQDLRTSYERQIDQLREELASVRDELAGQRQATATKGRRSTKATTDDSQPAK
ncbi:hypothetical protein [Georgenia muralis]